jgi:hypothetical protein
MKQTIKLSTGREVTFEESPEQTGVSKVRNMVQASFVPTKEERDEMWNIAADGFVSVPSGCGRYRYITGGDSISFPSRNAKR